MTNKRQRTRLYIITQGKTLALYGFINGVVFQVCDARSTQNGNRFVIGKSAFTSKAKAESQLMRQATMRDVVKPRKAVKLPAKEFYHVAEKILSAT